MFITIHSVLWYTHNLVNLVIDYFPILVVVCYIHEIMVFSRLYKLFGVV